MLKNKVGKNIDYGKLSIALHKKYGGKISISPKIKIKNRDDLSALYTPGVALVSEEIAKDTSLAGTMTLKKNTIAIVTDGSAVLGLGNIGPHAAIPVMEGKAVIMGVFAGVDAFPICLNTQNPEEIIKIVKSLEPVFGGINLEDIAAPNCFYIEERLRKELAIPVMHDDQWGAAVVIVAGIINSIKLLKKKPQSLNIVIVGAGAAGVATAKLLSAWGAENIVVFDSKGAINKKRDDLNAQKKEIVIFNKLNISGTLNENIEKFDIFIGLSKPKLLTEEMVQRMKPDPIIFALANPEPEILPEIALRAGAKIVGTGRSDFQNQINNSLFFPGFWRGMLDRQTKKIKYANQYDTKLLLKCAEAIASSVKPKINQILPNTLDKRVHQKIAKTILNYR